MHSRLCLRLVGRRQTPNAALRPLRAPLSTTAQCRADDPVRNIQDQATPSSTPISGDDPVPTRDPAEPSDARNPFLQGYPSPLTGRQTTSRATPDTTTAEPAAEARNASNVPIGSAKPSSRRPAEANATSGLVDMLNRKAAYPGRGQIQRTPAEPRAGSAAIRNKKEADFAMSDGKLLSHQPRTWRTGDVYAPHDLSPAEAAKNMRNRAPRSLYFVQPPTRNGRKDVLDELRIDPRRHYANFSMMAEFVSDMGKIKSRSETQLSLKNQRRMAKAVRRAIGIGIVPSVHRHPELFTERADQQGYAHGLRGAASRGIRPL